MIQGIGIDLVDIERLQPLNEKLAQKVLTAAELKHFNSIHHEGKKIEYLGGRFAIKEAFSKALGTGIGALHFQDIEILSDNLGKPVLTCKHINPSESTVFVTLSHTDLTIGAVVIIEKK